MRLQALFESGVVSYGSQAHLKLEAVYCLFESGVVSYGSQAGCKIERIL